MLRLSLSTFRERWQLFIGAIITVCIGVALVQSSLLNLVTAATHEVPADLPELTRARLTDAYEGGISLLGVTTGFSVFLAVFIVSSTFAFTVAQRRKDLALLRLTGGSPGQVRRLLLSEATLLGVIGTALGVPLGLLVMGLQAGMMTSLDLLPPDFTTQWQDWILAVSAGVGIGVALGGVLVASRRAAKIRALEALRDSGEAARVMTLSRWLFGLLFLGGAVAMMIVAGVAGPSGAMALAINAALAASVSLAVLSPLVVPLVSRLFGFLLRGSTLGVLAEANLRDGVRRSASTAAPLLVLVALLIAQVGAQASIAAAAVSEQARTTRADVVVESVRAGDAERLGDVPGVRVVSTERTVPVTATHTVVDDEGVDTDTQLTTALAVDPAYHRTHVKPPESGSLADLRGDTVALGPGYDGDADYEVGDSFRMEVGGLVRDLRVVAILSDSLSDNVEYLVPAALAALASLAGAAEGTPSVSFVQFDAGADRAAVTEAVRATGVGKVSTLHAWLARSAEAQQDMQQRISMVVMLLCGLYALIAVINAVVIAAADRRREFAAARVTGLSRGQVVRAALIESVAVTGIGLVLGGLASLTTLIGISSASARISGSAQLDLPLGVVGAVVAGAFLVVGGTSVWTSLSATRARPITLMGARE